MEINTKPLASYPQAKKTKPSQERQKVQKVSNYSGNLENNIAKNPIINVYNLQLFSSILGLMAEFIPKYKNASVVSDLATEIIERNEILKLEKNQSYSHTYKDANELEEIIDQLGSNIQAPYLSALYRIFKISYLLYKNPSVKKYFDDISSNRDVESIDNRFNHMF